MATPSQILIVDDETNAREQLYDALTRRGFETVTAGSGAQALELLKTCRPGLILMDVSMPQLSGLDTARKIRAFDPLVPLILLADGQPTVSDATRKELGILAVVEKSSGPAAVLQQLEGRFGKPGSDASASRALGARRMQGTLLIVDDEVKIQRLLKAFFEALGLTVLTASSGREALDRLAQDPQVVLLDVNMPEMDGLITLRKIKSLKPSLPVIMLSGTNEEQSGREALQCGAYDFIMKPFDLEYLESVVITKVMLGMGT